MAYLLCWIVAFRKTDALRDKLTVYGIGVRHQ